MAVLFLAMLPVRQPNDNEEDIERKKKERKKERKKKERRKEGKKAKKSKALKIKPAASG